MSLPGRAAVGLIDTQSPYRHRLRNGLPLTHAAGWNQARRDSVMTQQEQTRHYFRSAAADWQHKSVNAAGDYSVIEGRNRAVLDVVYRSEGASRFLDVGCGTGQLVIAVARHGVEADGIDFADEMVVQCRENAAAAGVTARFLGGSFFDASFEPQAYDVISAAPGHQRPAGL